VPYAGLSALGAFATTQLAQYTMIRFVYRSGDLAAIPWAYQSAAGLSRTGATGAFAFFAVFFVQLARNWRTLALPGG
jgi:hypothetical protein